MIPKVRFSEVKITVKERTYSGTLRKKTVIGDYNANTDDIIVYTGYGWKVTIALITHELIHWFQRHFLYRNEEIWDKEETEEIQEKQANKIENFVYYSILKGEQNEVFSQRR